MNKICPYCGIKFTTKNLTKKFCRFTCRDAMHNIKIRKTSIGLDSYDKKLYDSIHNEEKQ